MPSNTHDRITASAVGFPESPVEAGPRQFYLGLLAHLDADEPQVLLRFNEDETDEVILTPGSTRIIGRGPNRPIQSFQAKSLTGGDAIVTREFTEEPQPDRLVWHSTGAQGPEGPMGPQGEVGPAGAGAATIRVRAMVGANPITVLAGGEADLVADTEVINVGAAYDAPTGVLTIPVGQVGDYLVVASVITVASEMEIETHLSSDGGNNWTVVSRSPKCTNGARISDLLTLNDATKLKFVVRNVNGVDVDVLGSVGNEARSFLAITKIA